MVNQKYQKFSWVFYSNAREHNKSQTRAKQNTDFFMKNGTQPSQASFGGHLTRNPTQIDEGNTS
jgi:hypothetical protein